MVCIDVIKWLINKDYMLLILVIANTQWSHMCKTWNLYKFNYHDCVLCCYLLQSANMIAYTVCMVLCCGYQESRILYQFLQSWYTSTKKMFAFFDKKLNLGIQIARILWFAFSCQNSISRIMGLAYCTCWSFGMDG